MDLGLQGRRALVCGGSSGLGFAVAVALRDEGCAVVINGRDKNKLVDAGTRGRVDTLAGDVSTEPERIVREAGDIDILFCNAGGPPPGRFDQHTPEAFQQALELNLLSTMRLAAAALPGMRKRRWGRIICLTSLAGLQPAENLLLSTTARAGVHGFAKALSDEVAAEGITVNCIAPGFIGTERLTELFDEAAQVGLADRIPARRIGDPAEVGAAAAFLASEQAAYITGSILRVDGGVVRSIS